MKITHMRVGAIATACALVGAGAGIAGSSAATSTTKSTAKTSATKATAPRDGHRGFGRGRPDGMDGPHRGGPPVHEEAVVLNKAGTGYITQTTDSGLVKSVSGDSVVITEGTTAVPYKDVTVKIPSGATIMRNGKSATLADLKAGDHVHVGSSADGTVVFAGDNTFRPDFGRGHHGPGGDHDGPPPPPPPAP